VVIIAQDILKRELEVRLKMFDTFLTFDLQLRSISKSEFILALTIR